MISKAATVEQYLAELTPDRREALQAVRSVILKNLGNGYEEGMQYGAIGYYVPHRLFPAGYHCDPSKPLCLAGLGWQKNHMSLGIMCHYYGSEEDKWFRQAWTKTGKKLDMGACCIRFKRVEDVPLEVVGEAIRRIPVKTFIATYEAARAGSGRVKARKTGTSKAATKQKKSAPKTKPRTAGRKKTTKARTTARRS